MKRFRFLRHSVSMRWVRYLIKQFAFSRIFYRFAWPTKVPSYRVVTDLSIVISTCFTELKNSCFLIFPTRRFPFQQWEERKIKAGIWPQYLLPPFEFFEEYLKVTVTPEHEALATPSVWAKEFLNVTILAVAVYVTPARIEITWEKCTSNVLSLELVA